MNDDLNALKVVILIKRQGAFRSAQQIWRCRFASTFGRRLNSNVKTINGGIKCNNKPLATSKHMGKWVPYESKGREIERWKCGCEILLTRFGEWLASRTNFFWSGIYSLTERLEKVIVNDGQYFDYSVHLFYYGNESLNFKKNRRY